MPASWLRDAVFYQVYPQSFADASGDGIGDVPGLTGKLDYIASLGVTGIWLNPVFVSPMGDAGYDVADYFAVDPRYGTEADLVRLFEEAHARGIRIVLDLVAGHTSIAHPLFRAAARHDAPPEVRDRFIWRHRDFPDGEPPPDAYVENFFEFQPALNYGYARITEPWQQPPGAPGPKANRGELRRIIEFWMERGADGFRVDMAYSLVKDDRRGGFPETTALWQDLAAWFDERWSEGTLIAEWADPSQAVAAGFDLDFLMHFSGPGYPSLFFNEAAMIPGSTPWFDRRGEGTPRTFFDEYLGHVHAIRGRGYIGMPSANHDYSRPRCGDRDLADLRPIMAFLLTLPGVPFIYYGDEIGMRYVPGTPAKEGSLMLGQFERSGSRTPMQWDGGPGAGFSSAPAEALYLPLDPDPERPTVAAQDGDPASLLTLVRRLVQLRREHPALQADGELLVLSNPGPDYPLVYLRQDGHDRWVIVVNPAGRPVETRIALEHDGVIEPVLVEGATLDPAGDGVAIPRCGPVSWGLFRLP